MFKVHFKKKDFLPRRKENERGPTSQPHTHPSRQLEISPWHRCRKFIQVRWNSESTWSCWHVWTIKRTRFWLLSSIPLSSSSTHLGPQPQPCYIISLYILIKIHSGNFWPRTWPPRLIGLNDIDGSNDVASVVWAAVCFFFNYFFDNLFCTICGQGRTHSMHDGASINFSWLQVVFQLKALI